MDCIFNGEEEEYRKLITKKKARVLLHGCNCYGKHCSTGTSIVNLTTQAQAKKGSAMLGGGDEVGRVG